MRLGDYIIKISAVKTSGSASTLDGRQSSGDVTGLDTATFELVGAVIKRGRPGRGKELSSLENFFS